MSARRVRAVAFIGAMALTIPLATSERSWGQTPPVVVAPAVVPIPVPVPVPVAGPKTFPDPTQPDPRLKDLLNPPKTLGPAVVAGTPKQAELRLRGRVIAKDRAAAILEIDGQMVILPVGGEVNAVKVRAISADGVTVEVGSAKDVKVLH